MIARPIRFSESALTPVRAAKNWRTVAFPLAVALLGTILSASPAVADTDTFLASTGNSGSTPATDITSYRVSLDATTLTSTVYLAAWNLAVLQGAYVTTELDTNGDGAAEFELYKPPGGQAAKLVLAGGYLPVPGCAVTTTFSSTDRSMAMSVAASCLGVPPTIRVSHWISASGTEGFDFVPASNTFSRPTGAGPESGPDLPITSVYRFWSPGFNNAHFFTMNEQEAERLRYYDDNWSYEGVSFAAYSAAGDSCPGAGAVYRFYSQRFQTHFFTTSEQEKENIRLHDQNWAYEGVAYCASTTPDPGTTALHRFWSPRFGKHFYTADGTEAHQLRTSDPNWDYEGIAYYVLP